MDTLTARMAWAPRNVRTSSMARLLGSMPSSVGAAPFRICLIWASSS